MKFEFCFCSTTEGRNSRSALKKLQAKSEVHAALVAIIRHKSSACDCDYQARTDHHWVAANALQWYAIHWDPKPITSIEVLWLA